MARGHAPKELQDLACRYWQELGENPWDRTQGRQNIILDRKVLLGSTVLEYKIQQSGKNPKRWCKHAVRMAPRSKEKE